MSKSRNPSGEAETKHIGEIEEYISSIEMLIENVYNHTEKLRHQIMPILNKRTLDEGGVSTEKEIDREPATDLGHLLDSHQDKLKSINAMLQTMIEAVEL